MSEFDARRGVKMKVAALFQFGAERSSPGRAVIALIIAPFLMAPLAGILLAMPDILAGRVLLPSFTGLIRSLEGLGWALLRGALFFGTPIWLLLYFSRKENILTYTALGLAAGLGCAIWLGYAFRGIFDADMVPAALLAGVMGATTAATFWLIARQSASNKPFNS